MSRKESFEFVSEMRMKVAACFHRINIIKIRYICTFSAQGEEIKRDILLLLLNETQEEKH